MLSVLPQDLNPIVVWFQCPEDDLVVVAADGDEASVIGKPKDLFNFARVLLKQTILDPAVLPKLEDLHAAVVVVEGE